MLEYIAKVLRKSVEPELDKRRQIFLVYMQNDDGTEPLSCAVLSESEALLVEKNNNSKEGVKRTSWESHFVVDRDSSWAPNRPIFVVTEGGDAPVAIGVYADETDAREHLVRHGGTFVDIVPMHISQILAD